MTKDEMKDKISMALKDPILQQGFEIICKNLADLEAEKAEAKEIMQIAIKGISHWGIIGGTERPFEKQAELEFNLFLEKAEDFIKE